FDGNGSRSFASLRMTGIRGMIARCAKRRESVEVEIDNTFASVFHARGERIGRLEQCFLGRAFGLPIAAARDQLRQNCPSLRQGHPDLQTDLTGLTGRGDEASGVAVALEDGDALSLQIGLAAQPRGERKKWNEKTGQTHGASQQSTVDSR